MKSNDEKLASVVKQLKEFRQMIAKRGYKTAKDEARERQLLRAYRRLVESAG